VFWREGQKGDTRYDDFVALEGFTAAILKENLEGSTKPQNLQFAVDLTLLTRHAVHDT